MMSIDPELLSKLQDIIRWPYDAFYAIYKTAAFFTERYYSNLSAADLLSSLSLETVLPPLLSLITIYFALVSLYHTTSFFVRSTVFLVKWGVLIGAVAAGLGYMIHTFGLFEQTSARRNPSRTERPRPWDTFRRHQQWRTNEENQYVADAGRTAREMVEKIIDATQQATGQGGWLGSLVGMTTKTFTPEDSTAGQKRKLSGKGKGSIR